MMSEAVDHDNWNHFLSTPGKFELMNKFSPNKVSKSADVIE